MPTLKDAKAEADRILSDAENQRLLKKAKADPRDLIAHLEERGYRVSKDPPRERTTAKFDVRIKPGSTIRIGMLSDTHLNSRSQQLTALTDFYRYADSRGVIGFGHAGDLGDGHHVHRDSVYTQFNHGFNAQMKYIAAAYPKSQNGPTWFIEGNHDNWSYENAGVSVGEWLPDRRPDLKYLGYYSAFLDIGQLRLYLAHGAKGGGSYAKSYKSQKLIEQMDPDERNRTHFAFFGHWHFDDYVGRYQNVFGFNLPCFQRKTRFIKSIGKGPVIGGLVLEIEYTRDMRVWNVRQEWRYYEPAIGDYPGGEGDAAGGAGE